MILRDSLRAYQQFPRPVDCGDAETRKISSRGKNLLQQCGIRHKAQLREAQLLLRSETSGNPLRRSTSVTIEKGNGL